MGKEYLGVHPDVVAGMLWALFNRHGEHDDSPPSAFLG
jgi:hypothetical protein